MATTLSRRKLIALASMAAPTLALAHRRGLSQTANQVDAHIHVLPEETIGTIAAEIYSHFIEHLGGVIYDGVWVGKGSKIENQQGVRKAFIDTMREIKAPVLRWPGGCFADSYDWRDGIGAHRPQRTAFWGQEDVNAYGTHEFMYTCKAIGCEPYLAANVRSLPAEAFDHWLEYCNAPVESGNALAAERERNGSREPFHVKYWGVGNESWGCGGDMTPEEYAHNFRRYAAWLPNYKDQTLNLIACGPNGYDLDWTRRLFEALNGHLPWGLSTHYYVSGDPNKFAAGDALTFDDAAYFDVLARAYGTDRLLQDQWLEMQMRDPGHRVKFVVDEWGAWYSDSSRIGPHYNLSQVPTMRDALLTGITLDVFQRNADKVAMACVAQTINCLHSLMLARGDQFITTPVYNVFKMYMAHSGAQAVRTEFSSAAVTNPLARLTPVGGNSSTGSLPAQASLPGLTGSASIHGKDITLTVVNSHLKESQIAQISFGTGILRSASGMVLAEPDVHAHNSFEQPKAVRERNVTVDLAKQAAGQSGFVHTFPPASVTQLQLRLG